MRSNRSTSITGIFAISLAAILWGLDGIVLTPQLYGLPVTFVVFVLHAIPFALMSIFMYKEIPWLALLSKRDVFFLLMNSLLGGALGTLAIVKALFLVDFQHLSVVVLLQKLQPVFSISLASLLLKEKLRKAFLPWALLAIVAGYFLSFGGAAPNFNTGDGTAQAALYSLMGAACFGASTVFSRGVALRLPFYTATFFRFGITALVMLCITLFSGSLVSPAQVSTHQWLIILTIVVTTGSGAIFLYYYGLKKVPAMLASVLELLYPLSAIVFDYFFNQRVLSLLQWFSAGLMVLAIVKISFPKKTEKERAQDARR